MSFFRAIFVLTIKAVAGVSSTGPGAAIREGWSGDADIKEQI